MPTGDSVNFALTIYNVPQGDAVNFELAEMEGVTPLIGLCISGKIGRPDMPDPYGVYGIYQMRMTKTGKRPIRMKFYTQTNPQTEPQQANRAKFASAMSAWGSLTTEQKTAYNVRAKRRNMFGWGLFIREYYQSNT